MKNKNFDLGSNNVKKTFLKILIPTTIAQIISGTFVICDTFFVSRGFHPGAAFSGIGHGSFLNPSAYASLGATSISYAWPYTFFILGAGLAIGAGLSAIMTKEFALNRKTEAQKTMNTFSPFTVLFGVIIMIFLLIFAKVLVWFGSGFQKDYINAWFNNPLINHGWKVDPTAKIPSKEIYEMINGHILSQAAWYLRIQALATIPYIYMSAAVIMLRIEGKAHYATSVSAVSLVINVILDFLFVNVLKMNVVGSAVGTIIAQFVSAGIYYFFFKKKASIKITAFDWREMKRIFKKTLRLGVSIMMMQVLTGLILILFDFTIGISKYGNMASVTNYIAVYQGYNAIFVCCNLIIVGIAQSMKPIVEYNFYKHNKTNVLKARNLGYVSAMVFAILATAIVWIFTEQIIGEFYSVNGQYEDLITSGYYLFHGGNLSDLNNSWIFTNGLHIATAIVKCLFLTFPLAVVILMTGTYLQSLGEDKKTFVLLIGKVILLIPLLAIFALGFPNAITANWIFKDSSGNILKNLNSNIIQQSAGLGLFLSLPIVDILIFTITVYYLIHTQRKIIAKIPSKILHTYRKRDWY